MIYTSLNVRNINLLQSIWCALLLQYNSAKRKHHILNVTLVLITPTGGVCVKLFQTTCVPRGDWGGYLPNQFTGEPFQWAPLWEHWLKQWPYGRWPYKRLASLASNQCKGYYGYTKELKWAVHIFKLNCWQLSKQAVYRVLNVLSIEIR